MAAPQYVPTTLEDQPRKGLPMPPAVRWMADRPAELGPRQPQGRGLGVTGPDQGYALKLARRFDGRLSVVAPEHHEDAVVGCLGVATKRASMFGRAPVIHDLDIAFRIWGFLGEAPDELVDARHDLFVAAAHQYDQQREIADSVPEETLRLTHGEVARRFPAEWRVLLGR